MKCPVKICESEEIRIVNTYDAKATSGGMLSQYRGLNLLRRRRMCDDCGQSFMTVEILESDFQNLRLKTGRLEQIGPRLRPIR